MRIGTRIGRPRNLTVIQQALNVLKKFGTNAHVYLPGIGMLNGLQAANYIDSAGTQAGLVDQPVGMVLDATGGIHATQATTASKPILRRGAVAISPYSQDYTPGGWAKINITPLAAQLDPYGGTTATKLVESATVSTKEIALQAQTVVAGSKYTFAVAVKAGERSRIRAAFNGSIFPGGNSDFIDLLSGLILSTGASSSSSVIPLGNGWHLYTVTQTANSSGTSSTNFVSLLDATNAAGYLGDGTSGAFIHRAALFQGTYTAAQIQALGGIPLTTTAPASTALGPYFWQFDGVNDSLSLGGPLFQMADDHCVIAGISTTTQQGSAFHPSKVGSSRFGALGVSSGGTFLTEWYDGTSYVNASSVQAPGTVFVGSATRRGSSLYSRKNGVQFGVGAAFTALTTSTLGAIGDGGMGAFNGLIYPAIAIKGTVSDSDLLLLEKFVGQMSGVTI